MSRDDVVRLNLTEARGVALAAQGLFEPCSTAPDAAAVRAMIERLGVLQIDTISVVERTQYLVLWSRLGAYDSAVLDRLLYPDRLVFEYWGHAASIVPMADYAYYRPKMLRYAEHMWHGDQTWLQQNPEVVQRTLETVRQRGPLASADFERAPEAIRTGPWNWYGPKDSRRALEVLWTTGDLMIHSRRGGQKLYDIRERVLAEAFDGRVPPDESLPSPPERLRYFVRRTVHALGLVLPTWLWDYFRLAAPEGQSSRKRAMARELLDELVEAGELVHADVEGLGEPAYLARERLCDLEQLRAGRTPTHTTLLSPFDSLIWDRARARALFDYEVCFEAYVPAHRRRYGYYCLTILHRGLLVGRLDAKMDRAGLCLIVRALYLEPGATVSGDLLDGLAAALADLARFLGARQVRIERSDPAELAPALSERVKR